ncbi:MAG: hypothetical protein JSU63_01110 [Phycisphaerales bacterium]|nr:MAG: hypothetical protein JSU63_01110 [Phycisphaerales bacterium]
MRFGTIPAGVATQYRTVTIMRGDGGPIAPEIVLPEDSPGLDAHICEIESGEYYELVISVGPPWQARRLRELLYLKTGVEEVPEVRIFVTGTVSSP